jgi:glucokinase
VSRQAVIGVDLGGTNVRAGKVVGQEITGHHAQAISGRGSQETVLREIRETIAAVFDKTIAGIGIGVPSLVDVDKGVVYTVENIPSWKEVPLKEILERDFQVPVYVNNDANCFALGEFYFGAGRGFRDLVGMILGTGLGAGLVINGRLYCGRNCGAGEIGTIPYREHTVEYYSSGQFFQHQYGMNGGDVYEQALRGEPGALEKFAAFGDNLGQAVMTALYAYDPEIIVLGGSVSKAWPFFEEALRRRLMDFAWQHALARTAIQPSQTAEIAVLGAAALYLDARA